MNAVLFDNPPLAPLLATPQCLLTIEIAEVLFSCICLSWPFPDLLWKGLGILQFLYWCQACWAGSVLVNVVYPCVHWSSLHPWYPSPSGATSCLSSTFCQMKDKSVVIQTPHRCLCIAVLYFYEQKLRLSLLTRIFVFFPRLDFCCIRFSHYIF